MSCFKPVCGNNASLCISILCHKLLHSVAADLDDQLIFCCFPPAYVASWQIEVELS